MQLLEFQAKEILRNSGLSVPKSIVVAAGTVPLTVDFPAVIKSQVPVGGRGKHGGILLANSKETLSQAIKNISNLEIAGYKPEYLLVEEAISTQREFYVSLELNRDLRKIHWVVSDYGGVNIENYTERIRIINHDDMTSHQQISTLLGVDIQIISPVLSQLEKCFLENDMLLLEVNPLSLTTQGSLICTDAKVIIDDNAKQRQPQLTWPEENSIKPLGGNIGVIANGAGMAMSTMDAIYVSGARPANFLDIGGGTGEEVFIQNLTSVATLPGVKGIIINIFAGITRCDDIARGIIAAKEKMPNLPPLFIRLEGTNRPEAIQILASAGVHLESSLQTCIEKAKVL